MPTFHYAGRDQRGAVQTGQLDAVNQDEAVAQLQHRGLLVTSISAKSLGLGTAVATAAYTTKPRRMHRRVTTDDQVVLCQQLATLVEAGVPLLRSLEVASTQVTSLPMRNALEDIRRNVGAGQTLRDALARHPAVFSGLWLNLIETGEASGHLGQSLEQLAHHFESAQHLKNETKTALTYPMFLIGMVVLVLGIFVYWLIPKFSGMFESLGAELPLITRLVIGVSEFARRYVLLIAGGLVGGAHLLRQYLRTEPGQWTRDEVLLRLPFFKELFTCLQLAEFARGLSTLLDSGVPLLSSLEILEKSATNKVYGRAVRAVRESVQQGKTMAEPMAETGLFPPMTVQMVQVGEEVGQLGSMVGRMAKYYERQGELFIARMTRLFEPVAIVVMGILVAIIVLSIFLPIFTLSTGVSG